MGTINAKNAERKLQLVGMIFMLSLSMAACNQRVPESATQISEDSSGIIGGVNVQQTDSIARSIVSVYDTELGGLCTGSLMPNNIVITAAHCVGSKMVIIFGVNLDQSISYAPVTHIAVSPLWKARQNMNHDTGDIAVLKFKGTVPAGFVPAKVLNDRNLLRKGAAVTLAGYGISDGVKKVGSGVLRYTRVKIADSKFSGTEVMLDQRNGRGACHGDSGGPAYINIGGQLYLWGVTSRGVNDPADNCGQFSAYTNILAHLSWMSEVVTKMNAGVNAK